MLTGASGSAGVRRMCEGKSAMFKPDRRELLEVAGALVLAASLVWAVLQ
jgi:hypothetical protein